MTRAIGLMSIFSFSSTKFVTHLYNNIILSFWIFKKWNKILIPLFLNKFIYLDSSLLGAVVLGAAGLPLGFFSLLSLDLDDT
jgi:hypothetical protein